MKSLKFFSSVFFVAFLVMGMCFDVGPAHDLLVHPCEAEPYGALTAQEIVERARQQERVRCQNEGGRYYDGQCEMKDYNALAPSHFRGKSNRHDRMDWDETMSSVSGGSDKIWYTCNICGQKYHGNAAHVCPAMSGYKGDPSEDDYEEPDN